MGYNKAKYIYDAHKFRGEVWLLHGIAELYRAEGNLDEAMRKYEEAKKASQEAFNINRIAHALLGVCEVKRMKEEAHLNDHEEPLNIYKKIGSKWGIANTYISQAILYTNEGNAEMAKELLNEAMNMCQELNLNEELKLIQRIMEGDVDELHPLSLF